MISPSETAESEKFRPRVVINGIPTLKLERNLLGCDAKEKIVLVSTGAYCPIHTMHIEIFKRAKIALEKRRNCKVVMGFISPTHDDYVSPKIESNGGYKSIPAYQRLEMVKRSVEDEPWIEVSHWEVNSNSFIDFPSVYRYHKIELEKPTTYGPQNLQVWYLCGADHAYRCGLYRGNMRTVAVARPGAKYSLKSHEGETFIYIEEETQDFSSTKVREAMMKHDKGEDEFRRALGVFLHPKVVDYIIEEKISIKKE